MRAIADALGLETGFLADRCASEATQQPGKECASAIHGQAADQAPGDGAA